MMDLFFCHLATFFINLGENWLILKPCLTAALEVNLNADFDNRTLQSLSISSTASQSYFFEHKAGAAELTEKWVGLNRFISSLSWFE